MIRFLLRLLFCLSPVAALAAPPLIVSPAVSSPAESLAAREVRRYVYLRTGELLRIRTQSAKAAQAYILVARKDQPETKKLLAGADTLEAVAALKPQEYLLKKTGSHALLIAGGDDAGVLYGAYAFAEKLGVRFYLHADVVPDGKISLAIPELNETGRPLFALRGLNPWGSHPFGFDAWSADDYKAIFTQLVKMRMNFLGLHCYPEGHPYAEPTVWHGLPGDFDARGRVKSSYTSRYFNTLLTPAWGDYLPKKTGDYSFGGALLFERDDWAPSALEGHCPLPRTPEDCNDVFNRMAAQFDDAFTFARQLGVKTCLGTEAPLTMPKALAQRTNDRRAVYEGTFRRIMASHPLDYYWLWTPEGWTWSGNNPAQYSNTVADIKLALEASRNVNAPFQIATAGWVLGPRNDRAALDADLPKNIPISALNRNLGYTEVDPAFSRIQGRDKWAIPWLESDYHNGLGGLQLFVGRVRRDAADAFAYGCTGLMGLQWRTEILSPNIAALAQASWDQSWAGAKGWRVPGQRAANKDHLAGASLPRSLPCDDFYADWAQANFGQEEIGKLFASIDGQVPMATAQGCPVGALSPDATPWSTVATRFSFVDQLEKFRPRVHGPGNFERFDYWLNTFKYYRSLAKLRCALTQPEAAEITRLWSDTYRYLLATVNTPGALAMVVNMENHPGWGPLIAKSASQPWPKEYQGKPRLIVPTIRSIVNHDETLSLRIIALANQLAAVTVKFRPLGSGKWTTIPAIHIARAVYSCTLPAAEEDFEYFISTKTATGEKLVWPATAPGQNQTVVITSASTTL